jgi:recombination DNA repair RAD52 pathway protein
MFNQTGLTSEQYDVLIKDLAAHRVAKRKQAGLELSYLEAWDVRAHLIRIFGFGGWSSTVETAELAFEENTNGKWSVGYKVLLKLVIHDLGCFYTEAAIGSSTQGSRGEAHDMAIKTAESDALKRAAVNLGTQFGLSLYDNGSRKDVVGHSLINPDEMFEVDLQTHNVMRDRFFAMVAEAANEETLRAVWQEIDAAGMADCVNEHGVELREFVVARRDDMRQQGEPV